MSTHSHDDDSSHGHGGGSHAGEDQINFPKVIAIGVGSLAIFAVCTVWAARILKTETAKIEEATGRTRQAVIGQPEIGIVDQVPFASDNRLGVWQKKHAERLNGFGWVDRAKRIAHVPIEGAMDAVVAGALPAGAPR
jgi:hypothetical protein